MSILYADACVLKDLESCGHKLPRNSKLRRLIHISLRRFVPEEGRRGEGGELWVEGWVLSLRNSLAESNQFHGLSITEDITPIFSFPLLPIFPACLLCQWPCSAWPDWPGGGTRTHLFHPGALEEMRPHSSPLSLSLPHYFLLLSPHFSASRSLLCTFYECKFLFYDR